jgi:hypothetical protein
MVPFVLAETRVRTGLIAWMCPFANGAVLGFVKAITAAGQDDRRGDERKDFGHPAKYAPTGLAFKVESTATIKLTHYPGFGCWPTLIPSGLI